MGNLIYYNFTQQHMKKLLDITQYNFKPKPRIWNFRDIEGERFGHLYAVGYLGRSLSGRTMWLFHCDCGTYLKLSLEQIRIGKIENCGCVGKNGVEAESREIEYAQVNK